MIQTGLVSTIAGGGYKLLSEGAFIRDVRPPLQH